MLGRVGFGTLVTSTLILCVAAEPAAAQNRIPSVVQLPTFQFFSYRGTVVVPDGGTAYLGGNASSATGMRRRGGNRAFGQQQGISQATATVQIIDHDAIDRQLLGKSPEQLRRELPRADKPARQATRPADPQAEGKSLVRFARHRYQAGKKADAFDAYRMAIEVLDGRLRQLAEEEFRRRFGSAADQALRVATDRLPRRSISR